MAKRKSEHESNDLSAFDAQEQIQESQTQLPEERTASQEGTNGDENCKVDADIEIEKKEDGQAAQSEEEPSRDEEKRGKNPPPINELQKNLYHIWGLIYDYCYFVGIQLLRSTRTWRRRILHWLIDVEQAIKQRHKRRRYRLRISLHNAWRDVTLPFRELREQHRQFKKEREAARRYSDSEQRIFRSYLHMARAIWKKLWRVIKFLLNYIAPVAACITLYMVVTYAFQDITIALHVEYNGEEVGYITDEAVFTQAEKDLKERMVLGDVFVADPTEEGETIRSLQEEAYAAQQAEEKASAIIPNFSLTVVDPDQLSTADELTDRMIQAVGKSSGNSDGFAIEQADGLYIDNTYIGSVADGDDLLLYLNSMLERYRTPDMDDTVEIQFVKKIQIKRGLYPINSIRPLEEIQEILNKDEKGEKIYTVVAGDDPLKIAAKNGITFSELKALNPDVDIRLLPGDELLISQSVPYLGVKVTRTIKYEEEMEYRIEQQTDASRDIGYTYVERQGEKGLKEITAQVVTIDGVETERNVVSTNVIKEPVNQILIVGGNRPLKVIPTDSGGTVAAGAFAWPAAGGSIGTGWMGYWNHTGADIVWSGCYGTPVYASADGVVVASGWGGAYGYRIIVDHGGNVQTLYGHCSKLYVGVGEPVTQGQHIADIGRTGNVTGPHLHFEIRINGTPTDPAPYLYGQK